LVERQVVIRVLCLRRIDPQHSDDFRLPSSPDNRDRIAIVDADRIDWDRDAGAVRSRLARRLVGRPQTAGGHDQQRC
jgi:hypothetical protein